MSTDKTDRFGDIVTGGFVLAVVAALCSGIPGMGWLLWLAVIGIVPFMAAVGGAILGAVAGLFRR